MKEMATFPGTAASNLRIRNQDKKHAANPEECLYLKKKKSIKRESKFHYIHSYYFIIYCFIKILTDNYATFSPCLHLNYLTIRNIISISLDLTHLFPTYPSCLVGEGSAAERDWLSHALFSQMYWYGMLQSASFHSLRLRFAEAWSCPQSSPFTLYSQLSG